MSTHADNLAAALRDSLSFLDILVDAVLHGRKIGDPAAAHESIRHAHEVLAAHADRTFAEDCHELADRARVVLDGNPGLQPYERQRLRELYALARLIAMGATATPDLYVETGE